MSETKEREEARKAWWNALARQGDPLRLTNAFKSFNSGYDAGLAAGASPDKELLEALEKLNTCSECGGSDGLCPFCGGTGKNNIADAALVKYGNKAGAVGASPIRNEKVLDEMVRDFCKVGPLPKSGVRRRIVEWAAGASGQAETKGRSSQASEPSTKKVEEPIQSCPGCRLPIAFNPIRGWHHINDSNCSGVRDIPWPLGASGQAETTNIKDQDERMQRDYAEANKFYHRLDWDAWELAWTLGAKWTVDRVLARL